MDPHDDTRPDSQPPAVDDVQRVDAQPMDGASAPAARPVPDAEPGATGGYRFGSYAQDLPGGGRIHVFQAGFDGVMPRPPTAAAWICLAVAWLFLGSKIPFTVLLGVPFDLAALLLAAVCLSRGGVLTGVAVMALGTAGSLVVYLVGLFRFLAA